MPFQKGQVGNPNGRPKREFTLSDQLTRILKQRDKSEPGKKRGITNAEKIAQMAVDKAKAGEPWAVSLAWERTEGRAKQGIELSGGKEPIKLELGDEIANKLAEIYSLAIKSDDKEPNR